METVCEGAGHVLVVKVSARRDLAWAVRAAFHWVPPDWLDAPKLASSIFSHNCWTQVTCWMEGDWRARIIDACCWNLILAWSARKDQVLAGASKDDVSDP